MSSAKLMMRATVSLICASIVAKSAIDSRISAMARLSSLEETADSRSFTDPLSVSAVIRFTRSPYDSIAEFMPDRRELRA